MDVMANKVILKSKLKKGKRLVAGKKKIEKVSSPVKSIKSSPKLAKKKSAKKAGNLVTKKEVLKANLKSKKNVDSIEVNDVPKSKLLIKKVKKEKLTSIKNVDSVKVSELPEPQLSEKVKKVKVKSIKKVDSVEVSDVSDSLLSLKQVKKGVKALLKLANDETNSTKSLMADEKSPIFLQVCNVKIPKTPSRQLRMLLPHSLVSSDDDVALIVKDLKKGRRTDYEPTVDHFQQLLQEHKCKQIKTIIPMNQIKTEYDQYELKRNLLNSYDYFLVDGRISGHVARLLGRIFSKKRKLPTSIRMGSKDLKHEIDYALNKTSMQLHCKGDSHIVQIGTTEMPESHIVENIEAACKNLAKNYPGGWKNIRILRIKTPSSLALPIYMTMKNKNEVKTPNVKPKRPKAFKIHEGELTTSSGDATVVVTPDGTVTVKKTKKIKSKTEENNDEKEDSSSKKKAKLAVKTTVKEDESDEDEDDSYNDNDEDNEAEED